MIEFHCENCGKPSRKPTGHVNRSRALGMKLYCSRVCFGLDRRKGLSDDQRRLEKRIYDIEYRKHNAAKRKAQKAAYHKATYDPVKAADYRKARMPYYHVQYCRRPEYKAKKRGYDKKRRAAEYGPAAEAYTIFMDLTREIRTRASNYETKWENGTLNKAQGRRREGSSEAQKATRHRDRAA